MIARSPRGASGAGPRLVIDCRMAFHSGIGVVIRNLVSRLLDRWPAQYVLLGAPRALHSSWLRPNVTLVPWDAPIYSLQEQSVPPAARGADVYFAPHYNIPAVHDARRLAVFVHDVFHVAQPQLVPGLHRRLYARLMFSRVRLNASVLMCNSQFTSREFEHHIGRPVCPLHVIHPGIDPHWFEVRRTQRPHPTPYVMFAGNAKPNKNLVGLAVAFERIAHRIPHDLVLVGKRHGFIISDEHLDGAVQRLKKRIRLTGLVSQELLEQFYAWADAFAFPSLYEGFGLPPLEAAACGTAALVSRAAAVPEACGDGFVYCDPGSPDDIAARLLELLTDAQLRATLVERAQARARMLSWDFAADQVGRILFALAPSTTPSAKRTEPELSLRHATPQSA